jgi:hypothetical protein
MASVVAFAQRFHVRPSWLAVGDMPADCAGLAPTAAIRKMAGHTAH